METWHPSDYPWAEPLRTGLLREDGFAPAFLGADLEGRMPVVAVGSNASPSVLQRKLGPLLRTGAPLAVAKVDQLAVGHSAHVSARGYLAAAPYRGNGSRASLVGWFDAEQLAAMDATEPNYHRTPLPDGMSCRLGDHDLAGVEVYDSLHGVLGEHGVPLGLADQVDTLAWLADRLPGSLAAALDHEALTDLAARERVRIALIDAGLVLPSGL